MDAFIHAVDAANARIVAELIPSVVRIISDEGALGAGTIWHAEGLIITNAHVVANRRAAGARLQVELADGRVFPAQVIAMDEREDLAALAIPARDLPVIRLGDSQRLRPAQWVLALGHPWGVTDALTAGIIIGFGHNLPEQAGREWIALSLRLRPGHSGGPLVGADGALIGINTMIAGPEVGFAIPIHRVKAFLKETLGQAATLVAMA